jgi:bifunctional non-homologous end joining protein LigD
MSLKEYRAKRHFSETTEPRGSVHRSPRALAFVIQKHDASRLHYDFRLEMDGVLKSWAIPKGPSHNPKDRRLAIMVEDHPLEYGKFEGIIPEGNYGAGTVMVWDRGTYHHPEADSRDESERLAREGLEKGRLRFVLEGTKLRGEFSLIKLSRGKKNEWLLIKKADNHAARTDVLEESRSAATGRSLEAIEGEGSGTLARGQENQQALDSLLAAAPKGKMPTKVRPMLATTVKEPSDRSGWLFEIKWDGYRAIAEVHRGRVRFYSRNQLSFEERYAPIVQALHNLSHEAVLDGEVVVLDQSGKSRFQLLQNYQKTGIGPLIYFVFDLLYLDGHDLQGLPLVDRKEILHLITPESDAIRFSEHIEKTGIAFFKAAVRQHLEGIIAKDGQSTYRQGQRSGAWLKIKTKLRQEVVIGGFTRPRRSRKHFGSLVLGVYEDDDLVYVGHTGSGFTQKSLAEIAAKLKPLLQAECPFKKRPLTNEPAQWVKPALVGEVSFTEWTADGHMRHPIFQGLREDKAALEVRREVPSPTKKILDSEAKKTSSGKARHGGRKSSPKRTPAPNSRVVFTNLDKVYFPDDGISKGNLVDYYREISGFILPYLKDRPQSLHRHPNGIAGKSFFQKDAGRVAPEWVQTIDIRSESDSRVIRYLLCQDEATLLYLVNLGCIEVNPWNSRTQALDRPDYLVIDLDPEGVPFSTVVKAALLVRKVLDQAGIECYCKTTGKRGLHIYFPVGARYPYEEVRQFAEIVVNIVHARMPEASSIVRHRASRPNKVYLDFLQNSYGQTLAAPYSARPAPKATVSTPLRWQEVKSNLDISRYTIKTMPRRLDKLGDLWEPVLGPGVDLVQALQELERSKG